MSVISNNITNESGIYRNVSKNKKHKYLNISFVCSKYMC